MLGTLILSFVLSGPFVDPKAAFLKGEQKLRAASSLSGRTQHGRFVLQKPFSYFIETPLVRSYSNGKISYGVMYMTNEYFRNTSARRLPMDYTTGIEAFFGVPIGSTELKPDHSGKSKMSAVKFTFGSFKGRQVATKSYVYDLGHAKFMVACHMDAKTFELAGSEVNHKDKTGTRSRSIQVVDLRYNSAVDAKTFEWKPVPGMKERKL